MLFKGSDEGRWAPLRSREGIEDQAEPPLELVAEVVTGSEVVVGRHLHEVGVLAGGEPLHDRLGDVGDGVRSAPELEGVTGRYFANSKPKRSSPRSHDEAVAGRLWRVSADLVGLPSPRPR
jgi:hypothetical protein